MEPLLNDADSLTFPFLVLNVIIKQLSYNITLFPVSIMIFLIAIKVLCKSCQDKVKHVRENKEKFLVE